MYGRGFGSLPRVNDQSHREHCLYFNVIHGSSPISLSAAVCSDHPFSDLRDGRAATAGCTLYRVCEAGRYITSAWKMTHQRAFQWVELVPCVARLTHRARRTPGTNRHDVALLASNPERCAVPNPKPSARERERLGCADDGLGYGPFRARLQRRRGAI